MKLKVVLSSALVVIVFLQPLSATPQQGGSGGRDAQGSGAPPMTGQDPTQFEQFVNKLKIDEKKQLPQVQSVLQAGASDASPVEREMMRLRIKMLDVSNKPDELAAATAAYQAAAVKMTNVEIKAFGEVRALLKPNQTEKSAEAFVIMAGLFHPQTPRTSTRRPGGGELRYETAGFGSAAPQRGGGGGGSRGGGVPMGGGTPSRLVALSSALSVPEENRKPIKEAMDVEYKAAAPIRDQLTKTRTALAQFVASGAASEAGVAEYATAVAAMATMEMKALAKIINTLPAEQRPVSTKLDTAVYLMRGAFFGKKWDMAPDLRFY